MHTAGLELPTSNGHLASQDAKQKVRRQVGDKEEAGIEDECSG